MSVSTPQPKSALRMAPFFVVVALVVLPLLLLLIASFTAESRIGAGFFPGREALTTAHYAKLFSAVGFGAAIKNSFVVALSSTLCCVSLGALCAYALTRLTFPGRTVILAFILAVSMFPQVSLIPPLYLMLRDAGLINSYPGLFLPYVTFAMPLTVWLLVGYFRQLPLELEEAAVMDGMSRLRAFWAIFVPLAAPGIATTAILTFIYCWNEFLFAFSFTVGTDRQTVPVAITLFGGRYELPWGQILAAAVVATAPVTIMVLCFQKRIVQGLTSGAVKG